MPPLPLPPAGYRWRSAALSDAAALSNLFGAVDAAEDLEEVLGPAGIRRELAYPGLDLPRDTLIGLTPDGAARAFAWVWTQVTARAARAIVWIEAHPEHVHLEPYLMNWAEACARPLLRVAGPGVRRYLRQHVEEDRLRRRRVVEEAGYRHARTFVEMWRPLGEDLPAGPPPPAGVAVAPWSSARAEAARLASNAAFAQHWDSLPLGPEDWQQRVCTDPQFRPDLSRLALAGDEVVGLCLASVDAEHNAREGVAEMWVERVGTIPSHQRRGVAAALISEVLRAGAAGRFRRAGLGVDHDSATRATALYERLGFTATRRTLAYVKDLA
jgi:mycothiol synthase